MSRLLEILGRAISIDSVDLIGHWLRVILCTDNNNYSEKSQKLRQILDLLDRKKFTAASDELRLYLFENDGCEYGRLTAAAICLHENQLQDAIRELHSVYSNNPANTMALYTLGYCYERLGQEDKAIEYYQDCQKFKKYLQLPAQRLAALYFKNGQLEKAIMQYKLLTVEYPEDISYFITLGHLYIAADKCEQATEAFNSSILMQPDNLSIHDFCEINDFISEGRFNEALCSIEDILQQHPDRPDLLVKYADTLNMTGDVEGAVRYYEQAIFTCPNFLEAMIKLGTQYLHINQPNLAAIQFNKALEINDNIIDSYIGLSVSQYLSGLNEESFITLSLADAISHNSSLLYSETADLIFKLSFDENDALFNHNLFNNPSNFIIQAHRQQLETHPQNPDLHYRLGILMMNLGKISTAVELFETALNINPLFNRAVNKLAICLFRLGKKEQAMKRLTNCILPEKGTLNLYYDVSLLYCDKVRFASSLFNLERQLDSNFSSADATVNISNILQNLSLIDRPTAMWENLIDTFSRSNLLK